MEVATTPIQSRYAIKPAMVIYMLTTLCCMNVIYFVSQAVNPLIQADGWYFLDTNIRKWISQGFDWSDLFIKRGLTDHAQPLNKFFLYVNYKYFNLDFKFEALIGLVGYFSIILFFLYRFLTRLSNQTIAPQNVLAFSMAVLIFTSLNGTGVYTWSLVTFSFLPLSMAFMCSLISWRFIQKKKYRHRAYFFIFFRFSNWRYRIYNPLGNHGNNYRTKRCCYNSSSFKERNRMANYFRSIYWIYFPNY